MHQEAVKADAPWTPYWLEDPLERPGVQLSFFPYVVEPTPPVTEPGEGANQLPDDLIGMYFTG